jgi:hypothetical protein
MEVVNRWRVSDFERPTVEDVLSDYELENPSDESDAVGAPAD